MKNLLLIYTGINKFSHNIEKDKISKLNNNIKYLNSIYDLAKEFKYEILNSKNYDFIGNILDEYWTIKKKLSNKVSNYKIDEIYNECKNLGSIRWKNHWFWRWWFFINLLSKKFQNTLKKRMYKLPIIRF